MKTRTTAVFSLAFAANGRIVATGGFSGEVELWDMHRKAALGLLTTRPEVVQSVAFSSDSRLLAVGSGLPYGSHGELSTWDLTTRQIKQTFVRSGPGVLAAAWSPGGRFLAGATFESVRIWDSHTGKLVRVLRNGPIGCLAVAYAPKGELLACAYADKAGVYDPHTGRLRWERRIPGDDTLELCFSPDGSQLATVHSSGRIVLWDAHTGKPLLVSRAVHHPVYAIAFSPNGREFATVSGDRTIRLWSVWKGTVLRTYRVTGQAVPSSISESPGLGRDTALASYPGPIGGGYTRLLSYDEEGRLTAIQRDFGGGNVQLAYEYAYGYDGGRRWRKDHTASVWTWYPCGVACSAGELVEATSDLTGANWTTSAQYLKPSGCGGAIVRRNGEFHLWDLTGTAQVVLDGSGNVLSSDLYDRFGVQRFASGSAQTPWREQGAAVAEEGMLRSRACYVVAAREVGSGTGCGGDTFEGLLCLGCMLTVPFFIEYFIATCGKPKLNSNYWNCVKGAWQAFLQECNKRDSCKEAAKECLKACSGQLMDGCAGSAAPGQGVRPMRACTATAM